MKIALLSLSQLFAFVVFFFYIDCMCIHTCIRSTIADAQQVTTDHLKETLEKSRKSSTTES